MNPRGDRLGGFTPTYVDYFAPITGPEFEMQGEILNPTGRTHFVEVRFLVGDRLCAVAQATLIAER